MSAVAMISKSRRTSRDGASSHSKKRAQRKSDHHSANSGLLFHAGPVLRLSTAVQKKVQIGRSGDAYEQEADAAADRVVSGQPAPPITSLAPGALGDARKEDEKDVQAIQRQEDEEEVQMQSDAEDDQLQMVQRQEDEEEVQMQSDAEDEQLQMFQRQEDEEEVQMQSDAEDDQLQMVQRQAGDEEEESLQMFQRQEPVEEEEAVQMRASDFGARSMESAAEEAIASRGEGVPLQSVTRRKLEASLGYDLSTVRVHDDSSAHSAASALNARAFTHGSDIWLGRGESQHDTRLMAHEATHVVQQRGVTARKGRGRPANRAIGVAAVQRSVWSRITGVAGAAWDATGGRVVDAAGKVVEMGSEFFWKVIRQFAPNLAEVLRQISSKGIVGFLREKIEPVVSRVFERLNIDPQILNRVVATFRELLGSVREIVGGLASGNCNPLFTAMRRLRDLVSAMAGEVWDRIRNFFQPIGEFFQKVWQSFGAPVVEWLKQAAGSVWEYIQNLGQRIWDWTAPVRDSLGRAWSKAWKWIREKLGFGGGTGHGEGGGGLVQWVKDKAADAWDFVKARLEPVIEPMREVVRKVRAILPLDAILNLRDSVRGWLNRAGSMAAQMGEDDGVAKNQTSLREEILPAVMNTIAAFQHRLVAAGAWISARVGEISGAVVNFLNGLRSVPVVRAAAGALSWLKDRIEQLRGGIQSVVISLFSLLAGGLGRLADFVGRVLGLLRGVVSVLGNLIGRLKDLVLGPLWRIIPACIRNPITNFLINQILRRIPIFKQLLEIPDLWQRVKATALRILRQVFVDGNLFGAAWTFFKAVLNILKIPPELVTGIISRAASVIGDIITSPIEFLKNLLRSVRQGFELFFSKIWDHLLKGIGTWLFGHIRDAGIEPPADFSLSSILKVVLQILDITVERIFERLAKKIGPDRAAKIRQFLDKMTGVWKWVATLVREGPGALWQYLKDKIGNLWERVRDSTIGWAMGEIIRRMMARLATMLDPTGIMAVVNSFITFYGMLQTFAQKLREILEIVHSVLEGIGDMAKGVIDRAAQIFAGALASAIPLIISFLANQVGLGTLGSRLKEIFEAVRDRVNQAIDWLIDRAIKFGQKVLQSIKSAAAGVANWWKLRRGVTIGTKKHTLHFAGEGPGATLSIASSPEPLETFVGKLEGRPENQTPERKEILAKVRAHIATIRTARKEADKNPVEGNKKIELALDAIVAELQSITGAGKVPDKVDVHGADRARKLTYFVKDEAGVLSGAMLEKAPLKLAYVSFQNGKDSKSGDLMPVASPAEVTYNIADVHKEFTRPRAFKLVDKTDPDEVGNYSRLRSEFPQLMGQWYRDVDSPMLGRMRRLKAQGLLEMTDDEVTRGTPKWKFIRSQLSPEEQERAGSDSKAAVEPIFNELDESRKVAIGQAWMDRWGKSTHLHHITPLNFGGRNEDFVPLKAGVHIQSGGVHPGFWTPLKTFLKGVKEYVKGLEKGE